MTYSCDTPMRTEAAIPTTTQSVRFQPYLRGLLLLTRFVTVFLLLYSTYFHLQNNYQFLSDLLAFNILPHQIAVMIAALLPYLQLSMGLALLFLPEFRVAAYRLGVPLFLIFLSAQSTAFFRGLDIGCGCFGSSDDRIGYMSISITAVGLILCVIGVFASPPAAATGGSALRLETEH